MNKNIYYLSINSTSLAHYMSKAIILPSSFYKNRPSDIQNSENNYLILSKERFLNESNCSIELILTNKEIESIDNKKNFYIYPNPIPISRIKKIYFIDEIQKLKTIDNINRGTAFVPENLIDIVDKEVCKVDVIDKQSYKYSAELEERIKTYNHVLGGLAFVRYRLEKKYTENYFSILSHFNDFIKSKINNRYDKYDGAFTHHGGFWSRLSPLLYENISEKDVLTFSEQEKVDIKKSNGIFKYETINNKSITYKLAILDTYGEGSSKRKTTNDLIFDCKNGKIPKEKQEGISLIFGINNGYSNFRNQYDKKIIKFKMESLLDYYTIESVFQYVINDKKNNQKFEYVDRLFPNESLILDVVKESFALEKYLDDLLNYFKENIFTVSPKELISHIMDKFKNTLIEEVDKVRKEKDEEIDILRQDIVKKNNEIKKQQNIIEQLNMEKEMNTKNYFDEEKEKINIEKDLFLLNMKDLKAIAKKQKIKGRSKMKKDELIKAIKDNN